MATVVPTAPTSGAHPRDVVDKYLHFVLVFAVAVALLIGLKYEHESKSEKDKRAMASECVSGHPCVPTVHEDGSSDPVAVPLGKTVCFEPWIWRRLDRVGLSVSYQAPADSERPFPCSADEVYGGSCKAVYDRFRFKPKQATRLPNYWFVASGSPQC